MVSSKAKALKAGVDIYYNGVYCKNGRNAIKSVVVGCLCLQCEKETLINRNKGK